MNRPTIWPWLRPFLILVTVVAIPPLVYWFGYVQSSVLAAKQQGYSSLAAIASEFGDRLAAYDSIALSAEGYAGSNPELLKYYLQSVVKSQRIDSVSGNAHLAIEPSNLLLRVGTGSSAQRAVIPLDRMIVWDVVEAHFDGLLVLNKEGELLAQDRRLPAQPLGLPITLTRDGKAESMARFFSSAPFAFGKQSTQEQTPRRSASPFADANDVSVGIGGIEYLALLQPVSVPVTQAGRREVHPADPIRLVVCALIARDRLRRDAVQLAPQTFVAAGALVIFGLFAIPFLKLRFIGDRERMHPRDVWLLAGAILGTSALLTLLSLDIVAQRTLIHRFDAGLERFSKAVSANLESEANAAAAQLRDALPKLRTDTSPGSVVAEDATLECKLGAHSDEPLVVGSILARENFDKYADFEAVFTTDVCGNQQRKWMPRTIPTPRVRVAADGYFERAFTADLTNKPFEFAVTRAPTSGLQLGIVAIPLTESVRLQHGSPKVQRTDFTAMPLTDNVSRPHDPSASQRGSALSSPLNVEAELRNNPPMAQRTGIGVIASPMHSVAAPVIASPFEFVLLDRRGAVTFHSPRSFPGERFFDSIKNGAGISIAAKNGGFTVDNVRYRGRTYRMSARRIDRLDQTLVTFYDRAIVGEITARAFGIAALFALGIIVSVMVAALMSVLTCTGKALDWAWPSSHRCPDYRRGTLLSIGVFTTLFLVTQALPTGWIIALLIGAPFVFVLSVGFVYSRAPRRRAAPRSTNPAANGRVSAWFVGCAVLAVLAFVAWPTALTFVDAFKVQAAIFSFNGAQQWTAAKARAEQNLSDRSVDVGRSLATPNCSGSDKDARCAAADRVYGTSVSHATMRRQHRQYAIYTASAELLSDEARSIEEHIAPATFTVVLCDWLRRLSGRGTERANAVSALMKQQTGFGVFRGIDALQWHFWHLVVVVGIFGALWLLVLSVARHVLGLGLTESVQIDEASTLALKDGDAWLALRPERALLERLRSQAQAQVIDVTDADALRKIEPPVSGTSIVLDKIHQRLGDSRWRAALLALLQARRRGCIVMVSDIDPMYYLTQRIRDKCDYLSCLPSNDKEHRPEAEKTCRGLREELAEWARAMERVRKARSASPVFPAEADGNSKHVHAILAEECTALHPLIDIGKRLLETRQLEHCTREEIVGFVLDAAEPYYRSLWELCGREERLVLIQLAHCGLVNPKRLEIASRLARRGLVVVDPRFRLVNESFLRFVLGAEPTERVLEWERTHASVSWSRLAIPLYALAAIVIAILLYTEQGLMTNILAVVTGSAATLGSLRNLYSSASKPPMTSVKVA